MFPRQLEANGRQWSHPGEDSRTRSPTTSVSQRISTISSMSLWPIPTALTLNDTYITTTTTSPCSLFTALRSPWAILSQQPLRHWGPIPQQFPCLYDLYLQLLCYNDTYGWPISTALTLPDSTVSPTNTQALCYYNYYVSIIHIYSPYITRSYIVAITHTPLRPYITAITMSRWPISPAPTSQCYKLSQHLLLSPSITATTMST